ncbi:hypothetical protein BY458DRAFT_428881 [Sporodiniella umbellata]|nr:hypothetical protein BY458DRAFT_428881 [Sporodiniella umbellata]
MFWQEKEKALFKGTFLEAPVFNDMDDIRDDYQTLIEPLLKKHPYIFKRSQQSDPYSFEKFVRVSTLISSRAFEVDAYHEKGLVPFADLFSHCVKKEHVHFEAEFEVCETCGALDYCEHHYLDLLDEESEDIGILDDTVEHTTECMSDEAMDESDDSEDTRLPDLEELESQNVDFYDTNQENERKDYCNIVLDCDVEKGQEIFNTYGDLTSAELLSKYGFCFENNSNDEIAISEDNIKEYYITLTAKHLQSKYPGVSDEKLEEMAAEENSRRCKFFYMNEKALFSENECKLGHEDCHNSNAYTGEGVAREEISEEGLEEFEEAEDDEGTIDDDYTGEKQESHRLYSINSDGLFEDRVIYLLHILLIEEELFEKFTHDISNALQYFEELAKPLEKKRKTPNQTTLYVYEACYVLANFKRTEYFEDDNEWKPIESEFEERNQVPEGSRKYYALTYRINEKRIVEKCTEHYSFLVEECATTLTSDIESVKKQRK